MKDLFSSVQIKISIKAKVSLKCILEKFSISVAALVASFVYLVYKLFSNIKCIQKTSWHAVHVKWRIY